MHSLGKTVSYENSGVTIRGGKSSDKIPSNMGAGLVVDGQRMQRANRRLVRSLTVGTVGTAETKAQVSLDMKGHQNRCQMNCKVRLNPG